MKKYGKLQKNLKKIIDKIYGIDLYDFLEVFDEQFSEMLDVSDLKQKVIFCHLLSIICLLEK
jgi:hypothetical protein